MSIESAYIWMDGELVPFADAKVHVLSHSLHYGLGVFEGMLPVGEYQLGEQTFTVEAGGRVTWVQHEDPVVMGRQSRRQRMGR